MMLKNLLFIVVGLLTGGLAGFFLGKLVNPPRQEPSKPLRSELQELRGSEGFRFINPLLECDALSPVLRPNVKRLERELMNLISENQRTGHITEMSVYYRDLNGGAWIGLGVNTAFSPASLLKVPVMLTALRQVDKDKTLLNKAFKFDASIPLDDYAANIPGKTIRFGETYTLIELLDFMLVHSDNNAKNMLFQILGDEAFFKVWSDLGLTFATDASAEDFITVKDYSSFFRILFNATYLSKESSELALELLSRTEFDIGIQQGIPDGVVLSNKFGERGFADRSERQLHDAGIVYAGAAPYLLCIMTRGRSFDAQAKVIAEASRLVYEAHTAITPAQP
jgi:beta-lactamase class A